MDVGMDWRMEDKRQGWGKMEPIMNAFQAQKEDTICEIAITPAKAEWHW